jgi:hypothetical protein
MYGGVVSMEPRQSRDHSGLAPENMNHPLAPAVTLRIGTFTITIPARQLGTKFS